MGDMTTPLTRGPIATLDSLLPSMDQALSCFNTHSLGDIDKASLMNRVDTKFILPVNLLPQIFTELPSSYSVLEIDGKRCFRYESTYFDTDNYLFYRMHHGGRLNRFKVRIRQYLDSDTQYLEVKLKNNKKRTVKTRIKLEPSAAHDLGAYQEFLQELNVPEANYLQANLVNSYRRITLASEQRGERLTIDLNLKNQLLRNGVIQPECGPLLLDHFAVIELKQAHIDRHSPFFDLVRKLGIRSSSFSKYCLGIAFTEKGDLVKQNRFKPIVRRLQHLPNNSTIGLDSCLV